MVVCHLLTGMILQVPDVGGIWCFGVWDFSLDLLDVVLMNISSVFMHSKKIKSLWDVFVGSTYMILYIHFSSFPTAVTSHLFGVARPTCSAVCWSWVLILQHWMVMAVHQNLWRNVLDKLCVNKFYKLSWLRSRRSLGMFWCSFLNILIEFGLHL